MKRRLFAAIERFLIRHRILANEAEDCYYSWADCRLDQLALEARLRKMGFSEEVIERELDPRVPDTYASWCGHNH